jgi:hypothetical protein
MTTTQARILCGKCRSDLTGPENHTNDSIFTCPECGQSEKFGLIVKEAQEYFADVVKARLDKQLEDIAASSKFITVTKFDPPKRTYRFILDEVPGG